MNQEQETFILSPFYELPHTEDLIAFDAVSEASNDIDALRSEDLFILRQVIKDRLYLINPTIRYFLSLFEQPVTPNFVIDTVAETANCTPKEIAPVIENFARDMLKRQILIPTVKREEMLNFKEKMDEKEPMMQAGKPFHGYTICGELAMRGKIELYTAERKSDGMPCVIKALFLPEELSPRKRSNVTREFFQEFQLMKELNGHPNICELYEIINDNHIPAAAMEKIEGKSLRGWLKDQEVAPDLFRRLLVLEQVLAAISWVQQKGIFHGDIHASNFLINDDFVKLIDFDLANHASPEKNEIIRKGGVYEYIAPECLNKNSFSWLKQKANYKSEVYQLGIIMYFVMSTTFPFQAVTWQELAEKILNDRPQKLFQTDTGEEIPDAISKIIQKCLKKNPQQRYQNASTLHKQFQSAMKTIFEPSKAVA